MSNANPLLTLAVVLLAGLIGGRIALRLGLPTGTGQIAAGALLVHLGWEALGGAPMSEMGVLTDFALAFIGMSVGRHLHFRRLHNAGTRLRYLLIAESTITPLVTFLVVITMGGADWRLGLLLATMAVSTAPATVLALVRETHSKGVFTKTLVAAVALNNVACIVLFELAIAIVRPEAPVVGLDPFVLLGATVGLGLLSGLGLVLATYKVVNSAHVATISLTAMLAVSGLSAQFGLSTMLACVIMGSTVANLAPLRQNLGVGVFELLNGAIFGAFFTLAGAQLDFSYILIGGLLSVGVVLGRMTGKLLAAELAMRLADATDSVRRCLGRSLIPQAGVAVGLILIITRDPAFADLHQTVLAVGLTAVMVNEMIGPVFTRRALKDSGDMGRDRRRVIDFIQEEHITTHLKAHTLDGAIDELSQMLIHTNSLPVPLDKFVRSVKDREAQMSTCVGGGLAVPHARLAGRDQIAGVIGISRRGLDDETPDGEPVHLVVLMATSDSMNDRHLKVLGALARGLTGNGELGKRLTMARSPAHVYEMLHCREADTFNYFLDGGDTPG